MEWRIECQTCKHASCYEYGLACACDKDECNYEPYESTVTTATTYEIDWLHHDTQTKGEQRITPRYIDAEKIKYSYLPLSVMPDVFVTKKEIDEMPSEDVAPVVHAHWVYYKPYGGEHCSNCGTPRPLIVAKYCPHCGAIMDEKENEE